jgi:hypothetical protein
MFRRATPCPAAPLRKHYTVRSGKPTGARGCIVWVEIGCWCGCSLSARSISIPGCTPSTPAPSNAPIRTNPHCRLKMALPWPPTANCHKPGHGDSVTRRVLNGSGADVARPFDPRSRTVTFLLGHWILEGASRLRNSLANRPRLRYRSVADDHSVGHIDDRAGTTSSSPGSSMDDVHFLRRTGPLQIHGHALS